MSQSDRFAYRGQGADAVRRLPTAVPLFEAGLDLSNAGENLVLSAAEVEEILRKNALAVARLFWGEGAHEVTSMATSSQIPASSALLLTQTTFNVTADGVAFFQTFAAEQGQESWQLLASGEVRRGKQEPAQQAEQALC